ncbi:50S ribosomal protein L6 [Patescibacteria group bacterium]|nr:50S ribosomal protein L6 [Patescibacteria group bacterium]
MSRIAKVPVELPSGVELRVEGSTLLVKGPNGELSTSIPIKLVKIETVGKEVVVKPANKTPEASAASGLTRTLIANLVKGVTEEFIKELEFKGVGYRAAVEGNNLKLSVGYSHPVVLEAPKGISLEVKKNVISVKGADLQAVGQFAANIRATRPPEPYKGKGIKYVGEVIRRKAGKAGKAGEGA